ncbi:MAG TPA: methyltransferase domain-containing protein, partial [Jiangellaceae bacterium]|nr:methyltransferase domain-containing protein [Jiangellaceae bacterium]
AIGLTNVEVRDGNAESLPLPDASVDVVTSNGVINLVPDKRSAIAEIYRVLRPGGRVQIADIVVSDLPSDECRAKPQLWAECIVGATTEADYLGTFREVGFEAVERLDHLDYFAASSSESTRRTAGGFGAHSMVMRATKPAR